jgi:16S rRNA pseudouridine516 synthase
MRLDKFICKSTQLTKAEAIQHIYAGEVIVNGIISGSASTSANVQGEITESTQVHENNTITLNGQRLKSRPFRYILMHKPTGTLCSNTDGDYPSLFNTLSIDPNIEKVSELHIAGRLDVDTTGLVLITDDGRWTYNITLPSKQCHKVYRVGLSYGIADQAVKTLVAQFKHGIQLQGEQQLTLPAILEVLTTSTHTLNRGSKEVLLTISEGKYHQVKRMFAAVGNRVLTLHREKIGKIQLDVEAGQWRYLTASEIKEFAP